MQGPDALSEPKLKKQKNVLPEKNPLYFRKLNSALSGLRPQSSSLKDKIYFPKKKHFSSQAQKIKKIYFKKNFLCSRKRKAIFSRKAVLIFLKNRTPKKNYFSGNGGPKKFIIFLIFQSSKNKKTSYISTNGTFQPQT